MIFHSFLFGKFLNFIFTYSETKIKLKRKIKQLDILALSIFAIQIFLVTLIVIIYKLYKKKKIQLENKKETSNNTSFYDENINTLKKFKEKTTNDSLKKSSEKLIYFVEQNKNRSDEMSGIDDLANCKISRKGNWEEHYDINGNLAFVCMIDEMGIKNGEYKQYFKNGKIFSTGKYKNNLLDSECTNYFINGNVSQITYYENGLQNGEVKLFYESGELQSISIYNGGILQGIPKIFGKDGRNIF